MIEVSFEINGRRVSPNSVGDALEAVVLQNLQKHVIETVGTVRCNTHGQSPKITVKGKDLEHLSFEVTGCCDSVIEQVKSKLK